MRFLSCIYVVDDDRSQSPINVSSPVSSSLHRPITQQSAFSKPHPSATDVSHTPTAHSPKRQRCESPERPCEPVSPLRLAEGGYRDVPTLNRHTQENNVDSRLSPTPSTEGCDVKKSSPSPPVHVSSTHIKITNTGMVNNVDSGFKVYERNMCQGLSDHFEIFEQMCYMNAKKGCQSSCRRCKVRKITL